MQFIYLLKLAIYIKKMTKLSKELPLNTNQEEPTDQADILKSEEKHPSETSRGINDGEVKQSPKVEEIGKTDKEQQSDQVDITTEPEDHQLSLPSKELTDGDGNLQNSSPNDKPVIISKDHSSSFSLKTIWSRKKKSDEAKEKKEESANKSGGNSEVKEKTPKRDIPTEEQPAPRGFRAFIRRVRRFFGNCCRRGNRTTGSSRAGSQAPQEVPNAEVNNITGKYY